MKNLDFQGIYKYKMIMPTFFAANVFLFFFGPALCPNFTQIIYFVWTILITIKTLHMGFNSFYCLYQNKRILHRLQNEPKFKVTLNSPQILHSIIIPNYNEPMDVIKQTLRKLSRHSRATQTYFIYLAMQKKQLNCERKAQQLINEFRLFFKNIDFTVHELQAHEYPSKAANVNWCSRQLEEKFSQMKKSIQNCFLTIVDTDAELPETYYVEMENHIRKNWEDRFNFVFGPFNIFRKNHLSVPAVTRAFDHLVASFQMSNIVNITGFGFAISNYSASYNLIKKIDFWDTNEECITEDLHFMQKVCWKTQGQMKTVPIYVPANQMSIETGYSYWEDVQAKFWTSQRHFRSCNQIAYSIRMFFNSKFNWKTFKMIPIVLDTLALQAFYPIVIFAMSYHKSILTTEQMSNLPISYETLDVIAILSVLGVVLFMINYEIISRRSNEKIFGNKNNQKWYKFFEILILFPVVQYFMLFPANVYAIFGSLKTKRQWFMARNTSKEKEK